MAGESEALQEFEPVELLEPASSGESDVSVEPTLPDASAPIATVDPQALALKQAQEAKVREKLRRPISISIRDKSVDLLLAEISRLVNVEIDFDLEWLEKNAWGKSRRLFLGDIHEMPADQLLELVLNASPGYGVAMAYLVDHDKIKLSTKAEVLKQALTTRSYDIQYFLDLPGQSDLREKSEKESWWRNEFFRLLRTVLASNEEWSFYTDHERAPRVEGSELKVSAYADEHDFITRLIDGLKAGPQADPVLIASKPSHRPTEQKLEKKCGQRLTEMTLLDIIQQLSKSAGVHIVIDSGSAHNLRLDFDRRLNIDAVEMTIHDAIQAAVLAAVDTNYPTPWDPRWSTAISMFDDNELYPAVRFYCSEGLVRVYSRFSYNYSVSEIVVYDLSNVQPWRESDEVIPGEDVSVEWLLEMLHKIIDGNDSCAFYECSLPGTVVIADKAVIKATPESHEIIGKILKGLSAKPGARPKLIIDSAQDPDLNKNLNIKIHDRFDQIQLGALVSLLRSQTRVPIDVDWKSIKYLGVEPDDIVSFAAGGTSIHDTLWLGFNKAIENKRSGFEGAIGYALKSGRLRIGVTVETNELTAQTVLYDISALIAGLDESEIELRLIKLKNDLRSEMFNIDDWYSHRYRGPSILCYGDYMFVTAPKWMQPHIAHWLTPVGEEEQLLFYNAGLLQMREK